MPDETYLAEVSEPQQSPSSGECLSVYYAEGARPAACLTDPPVVSERPAPGHWQLLGVDDMRRRAYYARVEHGAMFGCAGRIGGSVGRSASRSGDR